jgi:hypothetical protein
VQIVGYETASESETATLWIASDGSLSRERLEPGTDLDYQLTARHCAGTVDDDQHLACERQTAPYCDRHTSRWACARCRGDCDLPLESCHEEHAVYLAAFAPETFKVGVTRSWRLQTRLREQGADCAAHLKTVADGRIARQIEADIASDIGDRVRVPVKMRGLHQTVEEETWETLLDDFKSISTYDFEYGLALRERPMAETILSGTVRGTQGRILVLDHGGSSYGVNMRDLVGYELDDGSTDRALQSSLTAFE